MRTNADTSRAHEPNPPSSRAGGPAEGLALLVFGLTLTLVVIFLTGSAPFVKAWAMGVLPW